MELPLCSVIPNRFNKVQTLFEIDKFVDEEEGKYPIARLKIKALDKNEDDDDEDDLYSEDLNNYVLFLDQENMFKDHFFPLLQVISPEDMLSLSAPDCPPELLTDFIAGGIHILDKRGPKPEEKVFVFFGHSVYNLKHKECFLYNEKYGTVEHIASQFGDFSKIRNPSKKAARLGLLLAPGRPTVHLLDTDITMINDIENENYNFTDGAGFISIKIAKSIVETFDEEDKELCKSEPYGVPSVFQIRVKGIKGILVLDPELADGILVRHSMDKYNYTREGPHLVTLVKHSKVSEYSALNEQYVRILESLGIKPKVLHTKLKSFLRRLEKYKGDEFEEDFKKRQSKQWWLLKNSMKRDSPKVKQVIPFPDLEPRDYHWEKMKDKLCIPVPESRNLYGVPDPTGLLKEGECFFQITINGSLEVISGRRIVVGKCPSYHPGDMRVLEAVDVQELHNLTECIVFPVKGKRPICDQIAGSDLDGDEYTVIWDKELIPAKCHPPAEYDVDNSNIDQLANKTNAMVTTKELKKHFCDYDNRLLSNLDGCFKYWFREKNDGIKSMECMALGQIFSQAVDVPKTGRTVVIPPDLWEPYKKSKEKKSEHDNDSEAENSKFDARTNANHHSANQWGYQRRYENSSSGKMTTGFPNISCHPHFQRFPVLPGRHPKMDQSMHPSHVPDGAHVRPLRLSNRFNHGDPNRLRNPNFEMSGMGQRPTAPPNGACSPLQSMYPMVHELPYRPKNPHAEMNGPANSSMNIGMNRGPNAPPNGACSPLQPMYQSVHKLPSRPYPPGNPNMRFQIHPVRNLEIDQRQNGMVWAGSMPLRPSACGIPDQRRYNGFKNHSKEGKKTNKWELKNRGDRINPAMGYWKTPNSTPKTAAKKTKPKPYSGKQKTNLKKNLQSNRKNLTSEPTDSGNPTSEPTDSENLTSEPTDSENLASETTDSENLTSEPTNAENSFDVSARHSL